MPLKWFAVLAVAVFTIVVWASDKISYEGERTVYSVQCEQGVWEGWRCTGKLVVGDRYRFRASKSRQEVIYWIVGSSAASGKYTDCKVLDRGNWTCPASTGQPATIAHEMVQGRPTRDESRTVLPFHAVPKWQWWLLDAGLQVTHTAAY